MPPRRSPAALAEIDASYNAPVVERRVQAALADIAIVATSIDPAAVETEASSGDHAGPQTLGRTALTVANIAAPSEVQEPQRMVTILDYTDMFERYQTPIINFIFRLVGNREEAYDLAQDAFIKAFRALNGGDEIAEGAFSSWLYRIASNTATDALRRRRLIKWLPLSLFTEDRGFGAGLADNSQQDLPADAQLFNSATAGNVMRSYDGGQFENRLGDREIIEHVLNAMPPKYRAALLLYEYQGLTVAETADVLRVSLSAMKMRLMRAREHFITLYKIETGEGLTRFFQPRRGKKNAQPSLLRIALQA